MPSDPHLSGRTLQDHLTPRLYHTTETDKPDHWQHGRQCRKSEVEYHVIRKGESRLNWERHPEKSSDDPLPPALSSCETFLSTVLILVYICVIELTRYKMSFSVTRNALRAQVRPIAAPLTVLLSSCDPATSLPSAPTSSPPVPASLPAISALALSGVSPAHCLPCCLCAYADFLAPPAARALVRVDPGRSRPVAQGAHGRAHSQGDRECQGCPRCTR